MKCARALFFFNKACPQEKLTRASPVGVLSEPNSPGAGKYSTAAYYGHFVPPKWGGKPAVSSPVQRHRLTKD